MKAKFWACFSTHATQDFYHKPIFSEKDMRLPKNLCLSLIIIFLYFQIGAALATSQDDINNILAEKQAPFGVVFEVVEGDDDALEWAMPAINDFVTQLRKRFPDIGLAVVTHGSEQFGLMTSEQKEMPTVHKTVQSLVASTVPVHVCGTHASWYGKEAKDFPDYVDVSPAGPTEISNYEDMGYTLVRVEQP
jgi:intracellular sulfur oxidation DsrE/DsrF family protein